MVILNLEVMEMRKLKKYAFVVYLSARNNLAYMSEVLSRIVFLGVILYIFSQLWKQVYSHSGSTQLAGLSLEQMIWYLTATEAIQLSAPRVSANVDLDVRSGALISYLQRPLSYPLYCLANNLGERVVRFLVNLGVGSVIAFALVGSPSLSLDGLFFFALSIPLAFVVDFLACFLIGLGAFWQEDTSGVYLIYSRISMMLGGMLFPISLFPDTLRRVVEWLPFSAITYGPAKLFVAPAANEFVAVVSKQLLGLVFLSLLVGMVYRYANRRVFVNGG